MNDINISRAYYYEFFSKPLFFGTADDFELWQKQAQVLSANLLDESLKDDFEALAGFDYARFKAEQNAMFYDLSYVNVPASASFYDEGRDGGRLKLLACDIIRKSRFRKDEACRQNEDEFSFVFAFCASVLPSEPNVAEALFRHILNPVIDEFLDKLAAHKSSNFFAHLARIMSVFFTQERLFLNIQAPLKQEGKSLADRALERLPYEPRLPTKFSKMNMEELSVAEKSYE